jgi:hypothetical protein
MRQSPPPPGTLASIRMAAELTGVARPRLEEMIRSGVLRFETIKGVRYVDLDEVERLKQRRDLGAVEFLTCPLAKRDGERR